MAINGMISSCFSPLPRTRPRGNPMQGDHTTERIVRNNPKASGVAWRARQAARLGLVVVVSNTRLVPEDGTDKPSCEPTIDHCALCAANLPSKMPLAASGLPVRLPVSGDNASHGWFMQQCTRATIPTRPSQFLSDAQSHDL